MQEIDEREEERDGEEEDEGEEEEDLTPIWSGHNPHIFYMMHKSLGHRYHMMPIATTSPDKTMHVSLDKLLTILEREL